MTEQLPISADAKDDLLSRGYSRRQLGRIAALFGTGVLVATAGRPAFAAAAAATPAPAGMVHIGANECWTGPFAPSAAAATAIIAHGNRYQPGTERADFVKALSMVEKVPADHIAPWPGSSDPLARSVVTFCSPGHGLVTADPTFELAGATAEWLGVKISRVPLRADHAHDVRAMLAADPNAGLYYICTPNNPSATLTPLADIEWLIANKPAGSIVLVDEAYIHFSGAPTASYLVAQGKDVIVLRTFSKLFGMAGMRMGATMARPDILAKMMRYDGQMLSYALPLPSLVCATTSLTQADLIVQRRAEMVRVRDATLAYLEKRGIAHLPSSANFFMVDWKKPAREMQAAFAAKGIEIGRSWPIWPTVSRVTVGSASEMQAFRTALDQIIV